MDITSVEFYSLALVVAFVLLGILLEQRRRGVASTHFATLELAPSSHETSTLVMRAGAGDRVTFERDGLPLRDAEAVSLVATIRGREITIVEKKAHSAVLGGHESYYAGVATVDFMPPRRWKVRFESQVTGEWGRAKFTSVNGNAVTVKLTY